MEAVGEKGQIVVEADAQEQEAEGKEAIRDKNYIHLFRLLRKMDKKWCENYKKWKIWDKSLCEWCNEKNCAERVKRGVVYGKNKKKR